MCNTYVSLSNNGFKKKGNNKKSFTTLYEYSNCSLRNTQVILNLENESEYVNGITKIVDDIRYCNCTVIIPCNVLYLINTFISDFNDISIEIIKV